MLWRRHCLRKGTVQFSIQHRAIHKPAMRRHETPEPRLRQVGPVLVAGVGNDSLGGPYAFDSIEKAQRPVPYPGPDVAVAHP